MKRKNIKNKTENSSNTAKKTVDSTERYSYFCEHIYGFQVQTDQCQTILH